MKAAVRRLARIQRPFSTINESEVEKFSKIKDWWNPQGSQKGLHAFNELRLGFVKKHIYGYGSPHSSKFHYMTNIKTLDVGCGPGIFTESIARLGATVVGLDANPFCVQVAEEHKKKVNLTGDLDGLSYVASTLEEYNKKGLKYDVVSSFEVIEHISDKEAILKGYADALEEGGLLFISTMEKNEISKLVTITLAENLMRLVEPGTHDHSKYINFMDLKAQAAPHGLEAIGYNTVFYNPLLNEWFYTNLINTNYICCFRKV